MVDATLVLDSPLPPLLTAEELVAAGYPDYRFYPNGRNAALCPFMFTWAILADLHTLGYEERWCYDTEAGAKAAFAAWNGEGEPTGWHRHPATGRRRPGGDPAKEYVNP